MDSMYVCYNVFFKTDEKGRRTDTRRPWSSTTPCASASSVDASAGDECWRRRWASAPAPVLAPALAPAVVLKSPMQGLMSSALWQERFAQSNLGSHHCVVLNGGLYGMLRSGGRGAASQSLQDLKEEINCKPSVLKTLPCTPPPPASQHTIGDFIIHNAMASTKSACSTRSAPFRSSWPWAVRGKTPKHIKHRKYCGFLHMGAGVHRHVGSR